VNVAFAGLESVLDFLAVPDVAVELRGEEVPLDGFEAQLAALMAGLTPLAPLQPALIPTQLQSRDREGAVEAPSAPDQEAAQLEVIPVPAPAVLEMPETLEALEMPDMREMPALAHERRATPEAARGSTELPQSTLAQRANVPAMAHTEIAFAMRLQEQDAPANRTATVPNEPALSHDSAQTPRAVALPQPDATPSHDSSRTPRAIALPHPDAAAAHEFAQPTREAATLPRDPAAALPTVEPLRATVMRSEDTTAAARTPVLAAATPPRQPRETDAARVQRAAPVEETDGGLVGPARTYSEARVTPVFGIAKVSETSSNSQRHESVQPERIAGPATPIIFAASQLVHSTGPAKPDLAAPAPASPSHILAAVNEPAAAPAVPLRHIALQVGQNADAVRVDVVERGGQVHVAVRTPDQELTGSLRDHLGDLVARVERSGFRSESWIPPATTQESREQPAQQQGHAQQQPGREDNPQGRQQQQQRQQQDAQDAPQWLREMQRLMTAQDTPKENRTWLQA